MKTAENRKFFLSNTNRVICVINKISAPMTRIAMAISAAFLVAQMFLIVTDVFLRNVFNNPIFGSTEIIQLMMSIAFSFGLAYCAMKKGHIRIDLVQASIPEHAKKALDILICFIAFCYCCLMVWATFQKGRLYIDTQEYVSDIFPIPVYPFVFIISFGMALLALVFLKDLVEAIEVTIRK